MIEQLPPYVGKPKRRAAETPSPFVLECRRLIDAKCAATTPEEKDDASWALEYAMSMHRAGRFDEYLAQRAAASPGSGTA